MDSFFETDVEFIEESSLWSVLNHNELGSHAERYILNYLLDQQFELVALNYREKPYGEVDIIVNKDETHYFIEVKARRTSEVDLSFEGIVTPRQYVRLFNAAELYSARHGVSVRICLALLTIRDEASKTRLSLRFLPLA